MSMSPPVPTEARAAFARDGVVVLPGFYDVATEIAPIWADIQAVIQMVSARWGLRPPVGLPDQDGFDGGLLALAAQDRRAVGDVYDAIKQIPAFVRLVASCRHDALFRALRPGSMPGVAAGGAGIRIDLPHEERFRAPWHQDYPAQLRSLDGLVFWSPLVPMTPALGPVRFALGSQHDGPVPVHTRDPLAPDRSGAYALRLSDEAARLARYVEVAPLVQPGDLVVIDYLTLHASGQNVGERARWSMQMRWFNFLEPTGQGYGWKGSFAAGVDLRTVHPELVVD